MANKQIDPEGTFSYRADAAATYQEVADEFQKLYTIRKKYLK